MTWNDWNPYAGVSPWKVVGVFVPCLFFTLLYEGGRVHKSGGIRAAANGRFTRGTWAAALVFYTFTILCATYFGREPSDSQRARWDIFWTVQAALETGKWEYWYYLVGNVLLFVPFGFILANLLKGKFRGIRSVWLSFLFSVLIEGTQYYTRTGLCELDDVIHNTLGGFLGVLAAWAFGRLVSGKRQGKK